jgi:hypothetical protein
MSLSLPLIFQTSFIPHCSIGRVKGIPCLDLPCVTHVISFNYSTSKMHHFVAENTEAEKVSKFFPLYSQVEIKVRFEPRFTQIQSLWVFTLFCHHSSSGLCSVEMI